MRTGPFSSLEVIERLNAFFVPVYAVNEDYAEDGPAPPEEKAEARRIYREALAKKFSAGSVHVYVLNPQGDVIDTRHVAKAADTKELLAMLNHVVAELGTERGAPLTAPQPQSCLSPRHEQGSLLLHLVARSIDGRGSWPGTAEDWISYSADEVKRNLPAKPAAGQSWEPDKKFAQRLLTHVYPVTENNDVRKNEFTKAVFRVTVLSVDGDKAVARIDAALTMRHDFYHKPDGKTVDANLVGYVEWNPTSGAIEKLKLVTDDSARYGGGKFAAVIRSE